MPTKPDVNFVDRGLARMDRFKIYNEDAYKLVKVFQEQGIKVDHIITDPPYNISQDNNFSTMKNPRAGVDFGSWDHGRFDLYSWIPEYAKLLNPNGSMIIFCSYRYISYIIDSLESEAAGMAVKDILVWQKTNPMPRNIERRYVQDMEFAVWAVKKNAKWVFNKPDDKPYARAMFTTPLVGKSEKLGHPTQKSLRLMEDIIAIHTNPGELILDPFMGSGSTGEAALNLGRYFMGIEYEAEFFEMARKRLEEKGDYTQMNIHELEKAQMNRALAYALGLIYPLYKEKKLGQHMYILGCVNHNSGKVSQNELSAHYRDVYEMFKECMDVNAPTIKANKTADYTISPKEGFSVLIDKKDVSKEECLKILTRKVQEIETADKDIKKEFIKGCFDGRASWDTTLHYLAIDVDRDYDRQNLIKRIIESMGIDLNVNNREPNHPKNDQIRIKPDSLDTYIANIGFYSECRRKLVQDGLNQI